MKREPMSYSELNQHISADDPRYSDAWRRVLNRLGEYTATIVRSYRMNPRKVEFLAQTEQYILIRIHMPGEYVILRIAPVLDLAREVYFSRTMEKQQLPVARIMHYDLGRTLVPFAYTIEGYIGGYTGYQLESSHMVYGLARQVGRILRRIHRIEAEGWGYPSPGGRWKHAEWRSVLLELHHAVAPRDVLAFLLLEEEHAMVTTTIEYLAMVLPAPQLMHGDIGPHTVRCNVGQGQVHLEGLVHPGRLIAGDGLLDLAIGMNNAYPQEWCSGLFEGYGALMPLSIEDLERLRLWQLLTTLWQTCHQYTSGEPYTEMLEHTHLLLAELRSQQVDAMGDDG
jgi:hypothetical protein